MNINIHVKVVTMLPLPRVVIAAWELKVADDYVKYLPILYDKL